MRFVALLLALWLCGPVFWLCGAGPASAAAAWRWPLDGQPRVTRGFDPPDTPYGAGHRGVDLAGAPGQAVRAVGSGRIGFAGVLAGRGVVTVVHVGGLKTTYEPVQAVVRAGQAVVVGQLIGRLQPGHAGCPVRACLHWGLLRGKRYLDPLSLLGAGHVRLLPLDGAGTSRPPAAAPSSPPAASPSPPPGTPAAGTPSSPSAASPSPPPGTPATGTPSSPSAASPSPPPGTPATGTRFSTVGLSSSAGPDAAATSGATTALSPSPTTLQLGVTALAVAALLMIRRRGP